MSPSCMYRVGIKAVIHNERGELLLTYEDRKGMRDLPGGGLETGNDIVDGLLQEIHEELGEDIGDIIIDSTPVSIRSSVSPSDLDLFLVAYRVYIDTDAIVSTEENQKRWFFTYEQIKDMPIYTNPVEREKFFLTTVG